MQGGQDSAPLKKINALRIFASPPRMILVGLCDLVIAQGRIQEFVQGGLKFFIFPGGGAQLQFGPENHLKSIEFTGLGGGLAPIAHPEYAPISSYSECQFEIRKIFQNFRLF